MRNTHLELFAFSLMLASSACRPSPRSTHVSLDAGETRGRDVRSDVRTGSVGEDGVFLGPEHGFASGNEDRLFALASSRNGLLFAAGRTRDRQGNDRSLILAFEASGALSRRFGHESGVVIGTGPTPSFRVVSGQTAEIFFDLAIDPAGRIVAVGQTGVGDQSKALIARFLPDGTLDPTFGDLDGRGPARKGFAIGMGDEFLDDAFTPVPPEDLVPDERFVAVAIDDKGRIVTAGTTGSLGKEDPKYARCGRTPFDPCPASFLRALVVRWTDAGVLDTSFHKTGYALSKAPRRSFGGGPREAIHDIVTTSDGGIIAAGFATLDASERRIALLVRYAPDGTLDERFGSGKLRGFVLGDRRSRAGGAREELTSVSVDPSGKIVVSGSSFDDSGRARTLVARLLADGSSDPAFAEAGFATEEGAGDQDAPVTLALDGHSAVIARGARLVAASAAGLLEPLVLPHSTGTASISLDRVIVHPESRWILAAGAQGGRTLVLRLHR